MNFWANLIFSGNVFCLFGAPDIVESIFTYKRDVFISLNISPNPSPCTIWSVSPWSICYLLKITLIDPQGRGNIFLSSKASAFKLDWSVSKHRTMCDVRSILFYSRRLDWLLLHLWRFLPISTVSGSCVLGQVICLQLFDRSVLPSIYWWLPKAYLDLSCTLEARASLVPQLVKNPPAMQETWVAPLGWEDPLEKGTPTHSSILAWSVPWTV